MRTAAVVSSCAVVAGVLAPVTTAQAATGKPSEERKPAATAPGTKAAAPDGTAAAETEDEAIAQARRTGKPVEILSKRAESGDVFATPDGKLEAREYLRPVRTRVDGVWRKVDTRLAPTKKGTVAPRAATVGLEFSGGGTAPLVRMSRVGRDLTLSWPTRLPKPRLAGDTATYPEILPGVDLRLAAREDGFTQLLVVKSARAAANPKLARLRLALDADGMTVRETSSGGLEAIDRGSGGAVFEAPRPVMWDSSAAASTAKAPKAPKGAAITPQQAPTTPRTAPGRVADPDPRDPRVRRALGSDAEPGAAESAHLAAVGVDIPADQSALVLRPDTTVLKGPDTVYPVYIDPQWYSPKATAWTMASKYWDSSPQWKFNGDPDAGMGFCGWQYCQPWDTKRLFYRIPVSKFAGKSVLSAEFVVRNTWSASCTAKGVELWRTKDISDQTTWNSQNASGFWIDHLRTSSFAYGFDGCAARDAEFDVRTAVQQAADKKWSTMTFGLRADNETDPYSWKRFSDDAFLRVKYNRPPSQPKMSQLTMEYGGVCKKPSAAPRSRSLGKIYANDIKDPDGDTVAVEFYASWDGGTWKPLRTGYKKSGSDFSISLPASIPQNKQIAWSIRVYDGAQWSPWSWAGDAPTACYFFYDATAPKPPVLTSADYPASDPENPNDPWLDGLGQYGEFELKANDSGVKEYRWGLNTDPSSSNVIATSAGAPKTLRLLPAKIGLNTLYVQSRDTADNLSAIATYRFRVKAGQLERAQWGLDDATGSTAAAGTAPERTAALSGGPVAGEPGALGTSVLFDGVDDQASTDLAAVTTDNGFSVSAWAKLSKAPAGAAVIAAQPGNHALGFELYYSKGFDRWAFNQYSADTSTAVPVRAMAAQPGGVTVGEWTHLVGTYSVSSKEMKLYVNGVLVGTALHNTPWDARRGLRIGGSHHNGVDTSFFPGHIDEVQLYEKPLSQADVTQLHGKQNLTVGRPARLVFPMDEPAGASALKGVPQVPSATYHGGVTPGTPGVSNKALTLDGVDDYASLGRPMVNNQRSFSVSAWARLPETRPMTNGVVATQLGTSKPGFELYYSTHYKQWIFSTHSQDSAQGTPIRAFQKPGEEADGGTWAHLVGVFDTYTMQITLYVNGVRQQSAQLAADWYAGGAFQIGATRFDNTLMNHFTGNIDDVRLFDRPVSAGEVQQMFRQRPVVKTRWTFTQATGTPAAVPDVSGSGNNLQLQGNPQVGPYPLGWVDGGIVLDGVDDHATARVPVDTTGSFTITGWAQAAAMPQAPVTVLSAPGASQDAFAVRYHPPADPTTDPGRWRISAASGDSTGSPVSGVDNGQFFSPTDWTHLALVYDGFAKELQLYVNGELEEVACADTDGDGQPDIPNCSDRLSWTEDVHTYRATQPLQLGRSRAGTTGSQYWSGALSDVWAFQGTLTEAQVSLLSAGAPGLPTEVPGSD
ncbi:LamG-like jellyroll fold domain-containing protein [Streptomyces sp. NPDC057638]|uniref:LamG-like jellyroll fold domain-containing protein n=1 Tax=Streptomyces sp. NPDC057638 TaxID=3346190 RepID=UPI0036BDABD9